MAHISFTNTNINEFYCVDDPGCWLGLMGCDDSIQDEDEGSLWLNTVLFSEQCEVVQKINALPQIILNWFFVKAYFLSYSLFYWK